MEQQNETQKQENKAPEKPDTPATAAPEKPHITGPEKPAAEKTGMKDYIEAFAKVAATFIAAAGFVFGIVKFQQEQRQNETLEFRRKLWEKRMETYTLLSNISGEIIINRNDSTKLDSLIPRFHHLYYSALILVEDSLVEQRVIQFNLALEDFTNGIKSENFLKSKQVIMMKEVSNSLKKRQDLLYD